MSRFLRSVRLALHPARGLLQRFPNGEILVREMAATEQEFRRVLEFAFPRDVTERDGKLLVTGEGAAMEIGLTPLPPRVIARLCLPRLAVCIRFTAGTAGERQALLTRLDRAMQRGGG